MICLCSVGGSTPAQTPAPAPQTFWNWMGIPSQPLAGIRNRGGNFPEFERKPALKKIADPANLASDNAAIKKAAEIKAQEDMAAQKIKAIKYLAEIGCGGCYEGVDKALAEALDDCTEAVRYEAVQAVIAASACGENHCVKKCVRQTKTCKEAACDCWVGCMKRTCATMHLLCGKPGPDGVTLKSKLPGYACGAGGNCPGSRCACGDGNCCTSEILNKLSTMAFEKDDRGCWKEPSPRVRAMARQALRACGPNIRPMTDADIPVPEEVPLQTEQVPVGPSNPGTRPVEGGPDRKVEGIEEVKPEPKAPTSDSSTSTPASESLPVAEESAVVVTAEAGFVPEQGPEPDEATPAGPGLLVSVDIPMAPAPEDVLPKTSAERAPMITVAKGKGHDKQKAADSRVLPFLRRW